MSSDAKLLLVCPTLNPGEGFEEWRCAVDAQTISPHRVLIVDSSSDDDTVVNARRAGYEVIQIKRDEFNHGATRDLALRQRQDERYVVFLTQDAVLSSADSLENLIRPFENQEVAAVCGRQLPKANATDIEAHARIYNYKSQSFVRSLEDRRVLGLKAAFLSNSFSAYRASILDRLGGFPETVVFGEDMYVAAKILLAGYEIAYASDACVYHSHGYSFAQEFRRYFDMGVFHAREPWLRREFGSAEGEGIRFVKSEINYLFRHAFWRIPEGMLRTVIRYTGFRLGLAESHLPTRLKAMMSMSPGYFTNSNCPV